MAVRTAEGEWKGDLKEGSGIVTLGSGAYSGPYSFKSRFEEGTGTNPLIQADFPIIGINNLTIYFLFIVIRTLHVL